ncbi:hypothetical protein [Amycolatopsis tolypomycina]|uniref:hypothetical protein n=1 Tax=Amycolatopsis tolypomycina TaxID=208445 RepID=UPI0033BD4887
MAVIDYVEAIVIAAPVTTVRRTLRQVEDEWLGLAPERQPVAPGRTEFSCLRPTPVVNWRSRARYRWLGLSLNVAECVTWSVEPYGYDGTVARAHVQAEFLPGLRARVMELVFTQLLGGVTRDRLRTRDELRYVKYLAEQQRRLAP